MKKVYAFVFIIFLLSSCGEEGKLLKREDFGDTWPLTVDEGYIKCEEGRIVFTVNDIDYAVNGHAHRDEKNRKIDPIWAIDSSAIMFPNDPNPTRKALTPIVTAGLELCEPRN